MNVQAAFLPDFPQNFDLIGLFDMLEHVEEDEKTLLAVRERPAPNGVVVITVPAFENYGDRMTSSCITKGAMGALTSTPNSGSRL